MRAGRPNRETMNLNGVSTYGKHSFPQPAYRSPCSGRGGYPAVLRLILAIFVLASVLWRPAPSLGSVAANTLVTNQAQASYSVDAEARTALSNQDVFIAN